MPGSRTIFGDYLKTATHLLVGVLGYFIPEVSYGFAGYSGYQFYIGNEDITTDVVEFGLGYLLAYYLKLN